MSATARSGLTKDATHCGHTMARDSATPGNLSAGTIDDPVMARITPDRISRI